MLLIFWVLWIIVALFIFLRDPRSFWGGAFIALGVIVLSLKIFWMLLNAISYIGLLGLWFSGIVLFLGIPLLCLLTIVFLIRNTLVMKTKEGRGLTGKLSAVLGFNLSFVLLLLFFLIFNPWNFPSIITKLGLFILLSDLLVTLLFLCYLFYSVIYQLIPVKNNVDYIIVLGAGLNGKELTPLLKSRVDKALQYQKYQSLPIKFIFSGGQGYDELIPEAKAMGDYARKEGISDAQIFEEDQSTTTFENMIFSKNIILGDTANYEDSVILFSTNNYHVLRSAIYARKAKLKATGIGAPTSFYFLPSALIREFIALLAYYKFYLFIILTILLGLCLVI